ncbi:hypothetical protein DM02DRAFT_611021 [Periconia macrospinosa]|uniref:Transcription elongation factor Eaf N-terminal domain-containing protein n=1 Tax=Periconia macrospinosa TaxID=97972 RepID=A0A2V1E3K6_9PLEO|nr:hypothetical protein DM02DRAFT_611021 [Periconia macrospinosa]
MASPMVESRVDPYKKAQYTLHISDQIADGEVGDYTSVHFNHKPAQTTSQRHTTISSSASNYTLRIEDKKAADSRDVFVFTGQRTVPKRSYILLFDTASQKATLEPLANSYTFNVSTKNGIDMSSAYPKVYPRKQRDDVQEPPPQEDIVDESGRDDVNIAADANNPYDFRHFLGSGKDGKNSDESEYNHGASSPDYRTGTGSAVNTPQLPARKPGSTTAAAPKQKAPATQKAPPKPRKRKSPEPEPKKAAPLPKKPPPAVRLERRATTDPKAKSTAASTAKSAKPTKATAKKGAAAAAAAAAASSKIKSAELVHSSDDESDPEDMLQPDAPAKSTTTHLPSPPTAPQRSPSPQPTHHSNTYHPSPSPARSSDADADYDEEDDDDEPSGGALEIEIEDPDAEPSKPKPRQRNQPAAHPHRGYLHSPANGPISLASVASSVEGTPRGGRVRGGYGAAARGGGRREQEDDGVIDFDLGGGEDDDEDGDGEDEEDAEADDVDVDPIDIGPPAARGGGGGGHHHQNGEEMAVDQGHHGHAGEDDDDDGEELDMEDLLYKEVMEGLAGGEESSEESEEE